MSSGAYIVARCAVLFISIITVAMTARAIMSWFFFDKQTKLGTFLYVVTEPIILPIRALCNRFGWFQGLPLDIPFFITAVLLMIVSTFLETAIGF